MYLKRIALSGFKSFAERTVLELGPGVSVIVGPNGSGKSNITDGILWALGEQSPTAVRSQAMQEVIFSGGGSIPAKGRAEVELVLDNGDGRLEVPFSELSICRRLDRNGEGEYLLNGSRCTLTEIHELLSDTGLGREAHSVVSQGRIETIVLARPAERRALIEEAAGLAKYRRRRQRAQRKLERTAENLARALDVEQEARSRLKPLERQAQAAELHRRLSRQIVEGRLVLLGDDLLAAREEAASCQQAVEAARRARAALEEELAEVLRRREEAEQALGERASRREQVASAHYALRSALEGVRVRRERLAAQLRGLDRTLAAGKSRLAGLQGGGGEEERERVRMRIAALEAELAELERRREGERAHRLQERERRRGELERQRLAAEQELASARAELERAERALKAEREGNLWERSWEELREVLREGIEGLAALAEGERERGLEELLGRCEGLLRAAVESALGRVGGAQRLVGAAQAAVGEARRRLAELQARERELAQAGEEEEKGGELAVRLAAVGAELGSERRALARLEREGAARRQEAEDLASRLSQLEEVGPRLAAAVGVLGTVEEAAERLLAGAEAQARAEREAAGELASELRRCAAREAELQGLLREAADRLTRAELGFQRAAERLAQLEREGAELERLGEGARVGERRLAAEERAALAAKVERLQRRKEGLGPVNPLAQTEYDQARAHVEELERQRSDLEAGIRELKGVIKEAEGKIKELFATTFAEVARNFQEVVEEVFPGSSGRLLLVEPEQRPEQEDEEGERDEGFGGVEIELRQRGRRPKRLSLLSGGEKSMTALAFLFSVFLARPSPFYVLDEVEAALDDLNLERFVRLLRRCAKGAQFIVVTHQRRTMEAADWLFGVSMGSDGVSKVLSRRMAEQPLQAA